MTCMLAKDTTISQSVSLQASCCEPCDGFFSHSLSLSRRVHTTLGNLSEHFIGAIRPIREVHAL